MVLTAYASGASFENEAESGSAAVRCRALHSSWGPVHVSSHHVVAVAVGGHCSLDEHLARVEVRRYGISSHGIGALFFVTCVARISAGVE